MSTILVTGATGNVGSRVVADLVAAGVRPRVLIRDTARPVNPWLDDDCVEVAFGDFDDQLIFLAPRSQLPEGIEEGMLLEASSLPADVVAGAPKDAILTITELYPEHAVLDGNHPLAGISLRLQLKVAAVREATEEEIESGSAGTGFFRLQPMAPGSNQLH